MTLKTRILVLILHIISPENDSGQALQIPLSSRLPLGRCVDATHATTVLNGFTTITSLPEAASTPSATIALVTTALMPSNRRTPLLLHGSFLELS
jgi:hypothetical protein